MSLPYRLNPEDLPPPTPPYTVLTEDGVVAREARTSPSEQDMLRAYRLMRFLRILDGQMLNAQRQGRISFYGSCTGQEASVVGSALALEEGDLCVPALREGGAALLRGFSFRAYVDQVFGNDRDSSRGRQMPCHYGCRDIGHLTLSSPVANQLPQAVGMAHAEKLRGTDRVVMAYMGDGGTAEADFHYAMNFASLWKSPLVFICQNNQWAISTPWQTQMATDTIAQRAEAYAMPYFRVDGNDLLGVHDICVEAVARARAGHGPTFVESLTYRVGAHSTSDDPSRYRDEDITAIWAEKKDPLRRLDTYLLEKSLVSEEEIAAMDASFQEVIKKEVMGAESRPYPPMSSLFSDVYASLPPHLERQKSGVDLAGQEADPGALGGNEEPLAPWDSWCWNAQAQANTES